MLDHEGLLDLIAGLYDAALDPLLWPRALRGARAALGGNNAFAAVVDGTGALASLHGDGEGMEHVEAYASRHRFLDPMLPAVLSGPTGKIWCDEMVQPAATLRRSEFYADFCRPSDMLHAIQVMPARERGATGLLAVALPHARGSVKEADLALARRLAPHVGRAMRVQLRLGGAVAARDGAMEALDRLAHGVFLLDASGRVTATNRAAESMLGRGTGLILRGGELRAADAAQTASLRRMVAQACRNEGRRAEGGWLLLDRADGGPALRVLVAPGGSRPGWLEPERVAALVLVDAGPAGARGRDDALAALFGLTRAESAVALRTAQGEGGPEIAAALGVTHNTVRAHLRSIFGKTGARGQAELGITVARLPVAPGGA